MAVLSEIRIYINFLIETNLIALLFILKKTLMKFFQPTLYRNKKGAGVVKKQLLLDFI